MAELFQTIAIVNRGEAAMRLIHAVREFNREQHLELKTVALYTEPERQAMFVREADRAVPLGEASYLDPDGQRKVTYLNYEAIERALVDSGADAVWVGWGFVAEHPEFADLCEKRLGLIFIGPDGECMRRLGDKISSKIMAEEAGVPVAPWSGGPVRDIEDARHQAERIGFPLMIKATAGGGGRGIRSVQGPEDLAEAFERATSEALGSFGDATVFMERMVEGARHIEVQVIADGYGTVWPVGVRDCSVQRFNQKLIEESSSPALSQHQEEYIKAASARLCRAAGYRNAGTVEFLYDMESKTFAFMEVNARLQVEHPVTEASTGLDLVKTQLHVALGGRLEGNPPKPRGTAIEVRLNAEDPFRDFVPAPGRVKWLRMPAGPGIRIDAGVEQGDLIPAEFDSMIAKIIAHGCDRSEALSRLRRALLELAVVIEGGTTNRAFLLELLGRSPVIEGTADVGWLGREPPSGWSYDYSGGEIALSLAAIREYEKEFGTERRLFLASATRGRPKLRGDIGCTVELRYRGNTYRLMICRFSGGYYRVDLDGESLRLNVENLNEFECRVSCAERVYRTLTMHSGFDYLIEVDGQPHRVSRDDGGTIRSPAPAIVVSVKVKPGDRIRQGDTLAILEAMKLEMRVTSPIEGTVRNVAVAQNEQVDVGAPLVQLMPSAESRDRGQSDRLDFAALGCIRNRDDSPTLEQRCRELHGELQNLILGFDVHPRACTRILSELRDVCGKLPADVDLPRQQEDLILRRFADVHALSSRLPVAEPDRRGLPTVTARSHQESLYTYLRATGTQGEGLSRPFLNDLKRALSHYGIPDLEPSHNLEEALLWLCKSHSRIDHQIPVVVHILGRRLEDSETQAQNADSDFHDLLDRLVSVSQGRYLSVADLAREVRYTYFDKPLHEAARESAYRRAYRDLSALSEAPDAPGYEKHMASLVQCPQPLQTILTNRFLGGSEAVRSVVIECMTRRYFRIRTLEDVKILKSGGHPFVSAAYDHEGMRMSLLTTHTTYGDLIQTGSLVIPLLEEIPANEHLLLEFYIHRQGSEKSEEETLAYVRGAIDAIPFPRTIRRIVTSVPVPNAGHGTTGQRFFTFRPSDNGFLEEDIYRGIHPMMAKRLHLYRFQNFKLERLPSIEDLYLFHATSRDNPKDERLFAVAEVRDLSEVRDEDGKLTGLPHLEHMLQEALAGIRQFQSRRSVRKRLYWNRIVLYVWPPLIVSAAERNRIVRKLFPSTMDLGLEKVVVRARMARGQDDEPRDTIMAISNPTGRGPRVEMLRPKDDHKVQPLTPYLQKVLKLRQRGLSYPYEVIRLLTPRENEQSPYPHGLFTEYDFDSGGGFSAVSRSYGLNTANIVAGVISNRTETHPEGMARVIILADPGRGMCPLAEAECSRIIAALDLAESMQVPVEWFAISAGAKIAMDSGTENLDWTAAVLRRIIEFTQAGGEINLVVHGVNVGAQSYWNAEATMLMHTRGILVMTPQGSMVLTGKQALDYSGGVSAEDNFGIGGYDRIMGPNGQAQYWAADIDDACRILLRHYDFTYTSPGERFPRKVHTEDSLERDVSPFPYMPDIDGEFDTVGQVFSSRHNPGRKRPFEIRRVMRAVVDQDHDPLERWSTMRDAEMGVVWDARLGGHAVCMIGFESHPIARAGFVPADGPDHWTAGTLFPRSSRKVARAINSASGNRPLVVLANLSGFDGSPESMRRWQLEYGAEIGRAVVNFKGPIAFCVVSRYHGGAFVVFSRSLNENIEVAALEGSYASVIGGAPAAAVVFARDVRQQTNADPRIAKLREALETASGSERADLLAELDRMTKSVTAEKRGELAERFDAIHTVQRAQAVGSVDHVIPPERLRPYLIEAIERGMARERKRQAIPATMHEHVTKEAADDLFRKTETVLPDSKPGRSSGRRPLVDPPGGESAGRPPLSETPG